MEMEQLFGPPQNEKPLISFFDIILGVLILGLMMIFLLVSIGTGLKDKLPNDIPDTVMTPTFPVRTDTPSPTTVTVPKTTTAASTTPVSVPTVQERIYQALLTEFQDDLPSWSAEIDRATLTVRFYNPETLFELGRSTLNQHYKTILADFFSRYVKILTEHQAAIEAISIEGHTSSEWRGSLSEEEAYFNNMALSQARTRAVLEYCLQLSSIARYKDWLRGILTANGLSSSRLIIKNGSEAVEYSRRVEFRTYPKMFQPRRG